MAAMGAAHSLYGPRYEDFIDDGVSIRPARGGRSDKCVSIFGRNLGFLFSVNDFSGSEKRSFPL